MSKLSNAIQTLVEKVGPEKAVLLLKRADREFAVTFWIIAAGFWALGFVSYLYLAYYNVGTVQCSYLLMGALISLAGVVVSLFFSLRASIQTMIIQKRTEEHDALVDQE
jgi:hypothetical protein